ncbi:MAG: hypothetical protein ABI239_14225 [Aquihabitans sp.]
MNVTSRAIPALAFMLLAAVGTACGVEGTANDAAPATTEAPGTTVDEPVTTTEPESTTTSEPDGPSTTTKEPSGPITTPGMPPGFEDQLFEELVAGFMEAGLTQGQATCLAESYGRDLFNADSTADLDSPEGMMAYFDACGINPMDLGG